MYSCTQALSGSCHVWCAGICTMVTILYPRTQALSGRGQTPTILRVCMVAYPGVGASLEVINVVECIVVHVCTVEPHYIGHLQTRN